MFNDNVNIIDTSSKSKNRKLNCVICYPKVELILVNEEEFRWKCPRCKNDYQILDNNDGDIIAAEDELVSSHDYDNEDPILVTADYTVKPEPVLNARKSTNIKIPKYMQNTDTTTVIDYQES
jgi:hypothetical protein